MLSRNHMIQNNLFSPVGTVYRCIHVYFSTSCVCVGNCPKNRKLLWKHIVIWTETVQTLVNQDCAIISNYLMRKSCSNLFLK